MFVSALAGGLVVATTAAIILYWRVRRLGRDLIAARAEARVTGGEDGSASGVLAADGSVRGILENAPFQIALKDSEGRYVRLNHPFEYDYGIPAETAIGKKPNDVFGSPQAEAFTARDKVVLQSRRPLEAEAVAPHPDGTDHEYITIRFPITDEKGELSGIGFIGTDITERKRAERALRESEEQLRTITENMPILITRFDRQGRLLFANRVARQFYGSSFEELAGRSIHELFGDESWAKLEPSFNRVMAGQVVQLEEKLLYPDGVNRHVEITYLPDFDDSGAVRGAFGLGHDVTDRKRLESDLLRKERLAALGQLTGTVAHELRNPLGAVVMSLKVIRRAIEQAGLDVERAMSRADRGVKRCETIITELLDFARAKGLQREPTNLEVWLAEVLDEQVIPDGLRLRRELRGDGVQVPVDRDQLRRAVINLIDNACQAMTDESAGGSLDRPHDVTVSMRADKERVEIHVVDEGPGIPADVLPQVMEPLFSTRNFGTGLGLPTVKRIMEEHGGGIEVGSAGDRGTRVVLWLPTEGPDDGDVAK
jgi:PAS domain S-box-containing protein